MLFSYARGSARCFTASPLGKLSSSCYIWFLPTTGSASQLLLLLLSLVLTFFSVLFALCLKKTQVVSSIPSTPGLPGETSPPPPASVQPLADGGSNNVTASHCENHVTWESPHTEPELTQVFQQPAFVDLHQQVFFLFLFLVFLGTFKGIHWGRASLCDKHKIVFFFSTTNIASNQVSGLFQVMHALSQSRDSWLWGVVCVSCLEG